MFNGIFNFLYDNLKYIIMAIGLTCGVYLLSPNISHPLKDYGDGIQQHLVWDIKGKCYYVQPNDSNTMYLIPVADCKR